MPSSVNPVPRPGSIPSGFDPSSASRSNSSSNRVNLFRAKPAPPRAEPPLRRVASNPSRCAHPASLPLFVPHRLAAFPALRYLLTPMSWPGHRGRGSCFTAERLDKSYPPAMQNARPRPGVSMQGGERPCNWRRKVYPISAEWIQPFVLDRFLPTYFKGLTALPFLRTSKWT